MKRNVNFKKYLSKKYFIILLAFTCSLFGGVAIGFISNLVKDQPYLSYEVMKEKIYDYSENSEVYFANGEKASTINYELMRKSIPLSEMGENIKDAIIASEDASFYSNSGIEPLAIIRATFNEITGKSSTGGSTLTQQLVKNQLLDTSRSYERKAKEIVLSLRINSYFSKNEILESYLNMAPFGKNKLGQNISGIETAALGVFGVHANELNIAQAAYLAGFVQSPFKYTPFDSAGEVRPDEELQAGFDRQKYVLDRMLDVKFITKEQYNEALNFDIKSAFITSMKDEGNNYPYIINEVITTASEILAEQLAIENDELEQFNNDLDYRKSLIEKSRINFVTGGYKVTTTIDKSIHDALNEAKDNYNGFISKNINGKVEPMQVGATLIENNTGKVLAFVGGSDYTAQQLNHATRTYRSPGSTIKPLLVYGPAIDKGFITPNSQLLDRRFDYNGWKPENFVRTEYGLLSSKQALAMSLNLATIRLYSAFYEENPVKQYLKEMNFKGLTRSDEQTLAASIGGLDYGVTVTENTNAFATFANGGKFKQAYIVDEIKNKNNEVIYKANFEEKQIYTEEASYLIVNMLHDVITSAGTAPDIAAAAKFNTANLFVKTGTAEFNNDLWVVGGTKNITFGLWTGYDTPSPINGYGHAHTQWIYFMNAINDIDSTLIGANERFVQPKNINYVGINPFDNSQGSVADLVPRNFATLSSEKAMKKLGSFLDKTIAEYLEKAKKDEDDEDDEDDDEKESSNSSNSDED